jgi:uncharacterized membrane-anchored protein
MNDLNEYPLRREIAEELHARPYAHMRAPVQVTHLVCLASERSELKPERNVASLCERFNKQGPVVGATHFIVDFGSFRLKWERHTEFESYTFMRETPIDQPFASQAIDLIPGDWVKALPGEVLVAANVNAEEADTPERSIGELAEIFDGNTVTGSLVLGGKARFWTDHKIHRDGYRRILIRNDQLDQRGLGRLIHRLLEIETYRMLAMLAFPLARQAIPELASAEKKLSGIVSRLPLLSDVEDERESLEQLMALAAEAETISANTAYRFSAARAYHGLVEQRVRELREERLERIQLSGNFLYRRLAPAMSTCENMTKRQETLASRIARASNLLRTRVDVAREEQNRELLMSMDKRAQLQLRLQETVEGLSVVAISYYLLGLISYLAKGAKSANLLTADPNLVVSVAFPVVIGGVWFGVRRIRRAISAREE